MYRNFQQKITPATKYSFFLSNDGEGPFPSKYSIIPTKLSSKTKPQITIILLKCDFSYFSNQMW